MFDLLSEKLDRRRHSCYICFTVREWKILNMTNYNFERSIHIGKNANGMVSSETRVARL
jgi:hypothetical protein